MDLLGKLFGRSVKIVIFSVETSLNNWSKCFCFVAIARQGPELPSVVRMRSIILTFPNSSRFGERQKHLKNCSWTGLRRDEATDVRRRRPRRCWDRTTTATATSVWGGGGTKALSCGSKPFTLGLGKEAYRKEEVPSGNIQKRSPKWQHTEKKKYQVATKLQRKGKFPCGNKKVSLRYKSWKPRQSIK